MEKSLDEIIGQRKRERAQGGSGRVGKPRARRGRKQPRGKLNEVKVSNLDPDLTEEDIRELFSKAGAVISVDLKINTQGVSTGIAFVDFRDANGASRAVDMFHMRLAVGRTITVTSTASLSQRIGAKVEKKATKPAPKKVAPVAKTAQDLDNELSLYMQQQEQAQEQAQEQPVLDQAPAMENTPVLEAAPLQEPVVGTDPSEDQQMEQAPVAPIE